MASGRTRVALLTAVLGAGGVFGTFLAWNGAGEKSVPNAWDTATSTTSSPSSPITVAETGWEHTGTTLEAYTGPSTITVDGTRIEGKDIRTCLSIQANDVQIVRSRITCAAPTAATSGTMVVQQATVYTPGLSGLTMTDVEVARPRGSSGGADYGVLIYGNDVTLTRVRIHNVTSGINIAGDRVRLVDSYIGDLQDISGRDHVDGVIASGGVDDVELDGNTIEVPLGQTTPLALFPERAPNRRWKITHNRLDGGGYCLYVGYTKGVERPNEDIVIEDNVLGDKFFPRCGRYGFAAAGRGGGQFLDGAGARWARNTTPAGSLVGPP